MRLGELRLIGLLVIALFVPATPAAAQFPQAPHREIQQPTASALINLGHADGYEIALSNPDPYVAILYVGRRVSDMGYTQTSYAVRPQTSIGGDVLRARFGSLGNIVLRFHPDGDVKVGRPSKHCVGRRPQAESGTYRGRISLHGENGYFRLSANRATGSRSRTYRLTCAWKKAYKAEPKPLFQYVAPDEGFTTSSAGGSIALLQARLETGARYVYLRAAHMQSSEPGAEVQASTVERTAGMAIGHSAYVDGGPGTLLTSLPGERPATATLSPTFPFHGEGRYLEISPASHAWSGTLAVSFPGLYLPLVGPEYATGLCVQSPFKARLPCDFQMPPLVSE